jgi:hypothetical protein
VLSVPEFNVIRVDIVGDPLTLRRACDTAGLPFSAPTFITSLNGIAPDEFGNFMFVVDDTGQPDTLLRVSPTGGDLLISAAAPTP